jgi:hypothetical protein
LKNATQTYADTICEIVGRWPGLDKQVIMEEGEKLREERHPGKTAETVKAGFKNVFSTQSKNTKNPRIQGYYFDEANDQGRLVKMCRYLLVETKPEDVQWWAAPHVELSRNQTTARDTQHDNDTIEVQDSSQRIRRASGSDQRAYTAEQSMGDGVQPGGPEGMRYQTDLQDTSSYPVTCNQDTTTPQADAGSITGERSTPAKEPAIRDESSGRPTYIGWDENAKIEFWGHKVRQMKAKIGKLRKANELLTELSSQSNHLKESQDQDMIQLRELEDKVKALQGTMRQRETEIEHVDQEKVSTSKKVGVLEEEERDLEEEFKQHYAEED